MTTMARETTGAGRNLAAITADVAGAIASATAIDKRGYAGGSVFVPAGATAQVYTIYASPEAGGTYVELIDENGNSVTLNAGGNVAASKAYALPPAVYNVPHIKLVTSASQQTGLTVILKS